MAFDKPGENWRDERKIFVAHEKEGNLLLWVKASCFSNKLQ